MATIKAFECIRPDKAVADKVAGFMSNICFANVKLLSFL